MANIDFKSGLAQRLMLRLHYLGVTVFSPEQTDAGYRLKLPDVRDGDVTGRLFFSPTGQIEYRPQPGAVNLNGPLPSQAKCDCCQVSRVRQSTWLLASIDQEHRQIGHSCMRKMAADLPSGRSVRALTCLNRIPALAEAQESGMTVREVLAAGASIRRTTGAAAPHPTEFAQLLRRFFESGGGQAAIAGEDFEQADNVLRWARKLPLSESARLNEDLHDMIDLTMGDRIPLSLDFLHLAARAPEIYAQFGLAKSHSHPSASTARKLSLIFDSLEDKPDPEFGTRRTYTMHTPDGQLALWTTYTHLINFEKGSQIEIEAPVRELPGSKRLRAILELHIKKAHLAKAKITPPAKPATAEVVTPYDLPVSIFSTPSPRMHSVPAGEHWLLAEAKHGTGDRLTTYGRPGSYHVLLKCRDEHVAALSELQKKFQPHDQVSKVSVLAGGVPVAIPMWLASAEARRVDGYPLVGSAREWRKVPPEDGELYLKRGLLIPTDHTQSRMILDRDGNFVFVSDPGIYVAQSPELSLTGLRDLLALHSDPVVVGAMAPDDNQPVPC